MLEHPVLGSAVVRDRGPLDETSLRDSVTDLTVEHWLTTLNERVFFFLQRGQVDALVGARRYRSTPSLVLVIYTARLVAAHEDRIELCRINSGFAQPHSMTSRGSDIFERIARYPHPRRAAPVRADRPDVKELTVLGEVPDIVQHVRSVERVVGGEVVEHLPL